MVNLATIEQKEKELELEIKRFELEQRRSMALSKSAFFPDGLKGDVASAVIIYDLSERMNISVLEVAQSIYIIYNKPSFATTFLVARLNQSGKIKGALQTVLSSDKKEAYCEAIDSVTGQTLRGMTYSIAIAKAEGLVDKKGSKWVTMPELMLRKRAQSNFINEFFPEVKFGLYTTEEIIDTEISRRNTKNELLEDKKEAYISKTKNLENIINVEPQKVITEPIKEDVTPYFRAKAEIIEANIEDDLEDDLEDMRASLND